MKSIRSFLFLMSVIFADNISATTWDEPWHDKVVKEADCFVLAKIKSSEEQKGLSVEIIKTLAGQIPGEKIKVDGFYLLDICSSSGHGPEFRFSENKECYFLLKKNKKGNYSLATPTSGFAFIKNGKVFATYRHSYHQALVATDVYEKTMTAIFNFYHNLPFDKTYISEYVSKNLALKPASFSESEISVFFAQHVALECIYHLKLENYYSQIIPFLKDTSNLHNQLSAARALTAYNTPECKKELMKVISDTARDHFAQVLCTWTLASFKPKELKSELEAAQKTASDASTGFGGNIMDPRVCTHIPNAREAIAELVKEL